MDARAPRGPRTLLVVPPLPERTYPGKFMGLDYLATSLLEEKAQVMVLDLDILGEDRLVAEARAFSPSLVGITNMSIQNDDANRVARAIRASTPGAVIVKGGVHETFAYETTLALHHDYVDACAVGEGEGTVREVARAVRAGKFDVARADIGGLAYWGGAAVEAADSAGKPDTDIEEHLPTRLTYDPSYSFGVFGGRQTAQVMASRGCANRCYYCTEAACRGVAERWRSPASVAREVEALCRAHYEAVYLDDSTFTRDRGWATSIGEVLRDAGMVWGCNTRVDCLDESLVSTLGRQGCVYLFCGVESGVPEVLSGLGKTPNPVAYLDQTVDVYRWLRQAGIVCSAFLIFGAAKRTIAPDGTKAWEPETLDDAYRSIRFAVRDLDPDYLSMNILRLLPGLPFSECSKFACIRPTGEAPVHGGHYDSRWYAENGVTDLRSAHPIYRAFEGCRSVNPPYMTPDRCYRILCFAVATVNAKNAGRGANQTEIVVDPSFGRFLRADKSSGRLQYTLAPFDEIDAACAPFARAAVPVSGG